MWVKIGVGAWCLLFIITLFLLIVVEMRPDEDELRGWALLLTLVTLALSSRAVKAIFKMFELDSWLEKPQHFSKARERLFRARKPLVVAMPSVVGLSLVLVVDFGSQRKEMLVFYGGLLLSWFFGNLAYPSKFNPSFSRKGR